jgi:hypothetical protein
MKRAVKVNISTFSELLSVLHFWERPIKDLELQQLAKSLLASQEPSYWDHNI